MPLLIKKHSNLTKNKASSLKNVEIYQFNSLIKDSNIIYNI